MHLDATFAAQSYSMKFLRLLLFFLSFFSFSLKSFAWGLQGHRIIGQVADSYLTKKARRAVVNILGNETLAMAGNWADFIKSDTNFNYLYNWHFINFKEGLQKESFMEALATDTSNNAYTKLNTLINELKRKDLSSNDQQVYLKLLIHLLGDIHQPMHTGRLADLGGNRIRVTWFNESSNLHRVWDEQLIAYQQLSFTEYVAAINFTSSVQRNSWQNAPVSDWIYESYQLAGKLYQEIDSTGVKLSYRYNFDHVTILNEQLLKAGVRLAGLLNNIFS